MSEHWDVLVVDDEEVVRSSVRLVMRELGWKVAQAEDAATALSSPAMDTCRILLCDMMLRGQSGLDIVREARRRRPELPIILITGYATPENAARGADAGATAFLPKPFDHTELLDKVRLALGDEDETGKEEKS